MFVVEDGFIRLRGEREPYSYKNPDVASAQGVFALGESRVALLYEVDHDVIRGSGRHLPQPAGALLRVRVNDRLRFAGPGNTAVTVTFPGTSQQGPSLGSTRALAIAAGATVSGGGSPSAVAGVSGAASAAGAGAGLRPDAVRLYRRSGAW